MLQNRRILSSLSIATCHSHRQCWICFPSISWHHGYHFFGSHCMTLLVTQYEPESLQITLFRDHSF